MSNVWISGLSSDGVAERGVDAALGRAGVGARRMQLRDDRDVGAGALGLDGGAHAGKARTDHHDVDAEAKILPMPREQTSTRASECRERRQGRRSGS